MERWRDGKERSADCLAGYLRFSCPLMEG